jgi:divalent metal cation (Fe/Co/Zn/Cd) transporter
MRLAATKDIALKLYFFILLFGWLGTLPSALFAPMWDVADWVVSGVSLVGLFAYCWSRDLARPIWRYFFAVFIAWHIFYVIYLPVSEFIDGAEQSLDSLTSDVVLSVLLIAPLTYVLYRMAGKSSNR